MPSTVLLTKFDLKPLVSRYPIECCIGGKPVLHCGIVSHKAKEHILAGSRIGQRKSYVSILLTNDVDGSVDIFRSGGSASDSLPLFMVKDPLMVFMEATG
jgi:hypothetical protein